MTIHIVMVHSPETTVKLKNLDFSNADGKLVVPEWCTGIEGTTNGLTVHGSGSPKSSEMHEFMNKVKQSGIKSSLKQHSKLKVWTPGIDCVF